MRNDDAITINLKDGRSYEAELRVYRIPSIYDRDNPDRDSLGLYLKAGGKDRCVTVNMHHPDFKGTHDAILRLVDEFATAKLGGEVASVA